MLIAWLQISQSPALAQTRVTLPYKSKDGWILLQVSVNGKPGTFIFDTGAQGTLVSPALMDEASKDWKSSKAVVTLNAMTTIYRAQVNVGVGSDAVLAGAAIMELKNFSEMAKTKIDGVLGMDVLRTYDRIEIDLKGKTVTLIRG